MDNMGPSQRVRTSYVDAEHLDSLFNEIAGSIRVYPRSVFQVLASLRGFLPETGMPGSQQNDIAGLDLSVSTRLSLFNGFNCNGKSIIFSDIQTHSWAGVCIYRILVNRFAVIEHMFGGIAVRACVVTDQCSITVH